MDETIATTFQSRLAAHTNRISKKLLDNGIRLSGTASDCIKISVKLSTQNDIISRKIEGLDVVSVIFPPMIDIPIRKIVHSSGKIIISPYVKNSQPIEVLIPSTANLDQDDLLFKFYQNNANEDPFLTIFQVKDMLGSFGARSIIYTKFKLTYYDGQLPEQVVTWAIDIAKRRELLEW